MRPSDAPTFGRPVAKRLELLPGQILVRVREEAVRPHVGAARVTAAAAKLLPESVTEAFDFLRREAGARQVEPLFAPVRGRALGGALGARIAVAASVAEAPEDLAGLAVVHVPEKNVTKALLRKVESARGVEYAEPMPARWLLAAAAAPDPFRNRQWGLRAIHWFDAPLPDASDVLVAVADTGVDERHPDLARAIDAYHHTGISAKDIVGHGTHVSGILGAVANDGVGIAGVSNARIAVWKIFGDTPERGEFYVDGTRFLRALGEIAQSGAKALNLSIGGTVSSRTEQLLFDRLGRFGVTVVAAMGNEYEDGNPVEYPAAYKGILAVGATTEANKRAPFSNTGRHIALAAPGVNILSTLPTTRSRYRPETNYASWSGTSMATPHVTGAAALLAAQNPSWTPTDVKRRLKASAATLPGMRGAGRTTSVGDGLLDLRAALAEV
ncbi:MAG TPA: S8 family serine peptidase [Gaiellaceae bacterium]